MSSVNYKSARINLYSVLSSSVGLQDIEEVMDLCQDFDMVRPFDPEQVTIEDVVKYGVLEHIMRVTTSNEDIRPYSALIAGDIAPKLSYILRSKPDLYQAALRDLESAVTLKDLKDLPALPAFATVYQVVGGELRKMSIEPEEEGRWPIIACFESDELIGLLYSTVATCVDGYDPRSGADITPVLTEAMMDSFTPRLSIEQKRKSHFSQTKPPKKVQQLKMWSSILSRFPPPPVPVPVIEPPQVVEFAPSIEVIEPEPPVYIPEVVEEYVAPESPKEVELGVELPIIKLPKPSMQRVQGVQIRSKMKPPKTIVLHKERVSQPQDDRPRPTMELVYKTQPGAHDWPWEPHDREAKELKRSRESCGLSDDCVSW